MSNPHLDQLLRLPVADRLQAIEELWDSLETSSDLFPLSDAERVDLDRRIAEDEAAGLGEIVTWSDFRRDLERGSA